jgi:glycosyltransferase involved in cell wall biosynthesis
MRNFLLFLVLILSISLVFVVVDNKNKKAVIKNEYKNKLVANSQFIAKILPVYESELAKINSEDYSNAQKKPLESEKIRFCIVIPSYNNLSYASQNLNSVFRQRYHNWRIFYVDDASDDGMSELVTKIKQDSGLSDDKFTVYRNKDRKRSALYGFYYAAHNFCEDKEIMVMLDGDDMLANDEVLSSLSEVYQDNRIWVTYGNNIEINSGKLGDDVKEISNKEWNKIRSLEWSFSHLRSAYVWLFKKIKIEDLQYQGKFFRTTWDLAIMFPMLEMAGKDRVKMINDVMYIYRRHASNDGVLFGSEQKELSKYIRSLDPYKRLD